MPRSHLHVRLRRRWLAVGLCAVLVVGVPATVVAAPCWRPPVDAPVSDPYREPACRWCPGNRGIEYRTDPGTPVRAVAAGRVTFAGSIAGTRYVVVEHADGWRATYGDLAAVAVARGDTVVARTVVGTTRARLHFGLRDGERYIDPAPMLGRLTYPVRLIPADGSRAAPPGPPRLRCDVR